MEEALDKVENKYGSTVTVMLHGNRFTPEQEYNLGCALGHLKLLFEDKTSGNIKVGSNTNTKTHESDGIHITSTGQIGGVVFLENANSLTPAEFDALINPNRQRR